MAIVLGR